MAQPRADGSQKMRRRTLVPLFAAAGLFTGCGAAETDALRAGAVQESALHVRSAIPAIEAVAADHYGSYAQLTLTRARRWDATIRHITIRRAARGGYCIESTTEPVVHYAGPHGSVREGRCGLRGAVVPFVPPPRKPRPTGDEAAAQERLRYAVPAAAGFATDNNGYAGMTIEKLRRYDQGVRDITIRWTHRDGYCAEATAGATTYHQVGPAEAPTPGPCPAHHH